MRSALHQTLALAIGLVAHGAAAQGDPGRSSLGERAVPFEQRSIFSIGLDHSSVSSDFLSGYVGLDDLGGWGMNLRLLLHKGRLRERLKVGGEFGTFQLDEARAGCGPDVCTPGTDKTGLFLGGLVDLYLFQMSTTAVHLDGSPGIVVYLNLPNPAGLLPKPGTELLLSSRLVASIPVGTHVSLDPYVGLRHARGDTARACQSFERAIASGGWPGFGFIVAKAELRRLPW